MMKYGIMLISIFMLANPALADLFFEFMEYDPDQVDLVWTVVPDGSGPAAAEARCPDGSFWDRDLRLRPWFTIWGDPGGPQSLPAGFPAEDIWLVSESGGLVSCAGGSTADLVDSDGWIVWFSPLMAGGCNDTADPTRLVVVGMIIDSHIPCWFRSPDISGDLMVNLTDITLFTEALHGAAQAWRADFNRDDVVNLADIVVFTQGLGAVCP